MNENTQFITKAEFCLFCGISESTAYKLLKSGKIHFEKCCEGLLHYYKIPLREAEKYRKEIPHKGVLDEHQVAKVKAYYKEKLKSYSNVIDAKDIRIITGYGKEAIRTWINSEKILGIVVRKRFQVAKDDLIDFLVSPYYQNIIRKSKTHIEDEKITDLL